jgi:hypothetical protein
MLIHTWKGVLVIACPLLIDLAPAIITNTISMGRIYSWVDGLNEISMHLGMD